MGDALLRLMPFRLRLKEPLRTALGTHTVREGVSLVLEDGAGATGIGEATPLQSFGTESLGECLATLSEATGRIQSTRLPESLQEIPAALQAMGMTRSRPAARHGLELAMLDLIAHRAGVSLSNLLSPASRKFVAVNALLTSREPEALVKQGQSALAQGYQTLKVKVGGAPLSEDLERIAVLRAAVGPAARIRIDVNGGWTEEEARTAINSLAPLELCEQPVGAEDVEALRRLRGTVPCVIAGDEVLSSEERREAVLADPPACDVLVLKPMVLGGILTALELSRRAAAKGLDCYVTSAMDGVIARAGAAHLAAAIAPSGYSSGLAVGSLFSDEPQGHPYVPLRGRINLPNTPGLGLAGWHAGRGLA